jgi:hypothetical protein
VIVIALMHKYHLMDIDQYSSHCDQPTSTYAANFRLIASDIHWNEQALMEQFRSTLVVM